MNAQNHSDRIGMINAMISYFNSNKKTQRSVEA